jgi:hypothetical protein
MNRKKSDQQKQRRRIEQRRTHEARPAKQTRTTGIENPHRLEEEEPGKVSVKAAVANRPHNAASH